MRGGRRSEHRPSAFLRQGARQTPAPAACVGAQAKNPLLGRRGDLAAKMTPAQIAEAQRMARERKPNMNANEQMIREQAYELWDNAGRPDGRSDEVFRRRADPPHPNRLQCRGSNTQGPFEIGRGGHVANSNLGNGLLRPETFGETRQELPLRIAGPSAETDT
jgi:hypothetical protein